jgi:exo-beta-1,3-glucanase (GH17 family)
MRFPLFVAILCAMTACSPETNPNSLAPVKVEIVKSDSGYRLLRDGQPYVIKGAGMVVDDIERFAANGGNSIRNWSTLSRKQDTPALLDAAHEHGVTVALGLPVKTERGGFDYNDREAVAAQLELIRAEVLKYRDHPALLFWIIGNELNHSYTNPRVYDAVNEIAEMIQELDSNHPVTTTTSGFKPEVNAEILARAPALDFISFQMYGSLFGLPEQLVETGFEQPFMVTEWGTIGYWEMETTDWGTPFEATSSEKADILLRAHRDILAPLEGQLIGSYVFFWGQKQERTPTWFGLLTEDGRTTEVVDVMHHIWTGGWPDNRTPRVEAIQLDGKGGRPNVVLTTGQAYEAVVDVVDPDGDPLTYWWELKPESRATSAGGDFEPAVPNLDGYLANDSATIVTLTAPPPGKYRLFAYAADEFGHVAHANVPLLVEGEFKQSADALVAGEVMAVAYSGFRENQHPDLGEGAVNPSDAEILEDFEILVEHGFKLIRMYDSGDYARRALQLIREHELPIKMLLGIWLRAEVSNHLGCAWLTEPIPDDELAANVLWNEDEVRRGIQLAQEFSDIVVAVNVGNEALVDWNDHMMPLERVIDFVKAVQAEVGQPVTVADNYDWWRRDGAPLAAVVDFIGIHTYPVWEDKPIEEALAYTIENVESVRQALPGKPIAILEAGWATSATEFGERANEADQARYFAEMKAWADTTNTTVFLFEAFDEPWKGDQTDPLGAEKHWGLYFVDRTPKLVFRPVSEDAAD